MNYITSVSTNEAAASVGGKIVLTVEGSENSVFSVEIVRTDNNQRYNFETETFAALTNHGSSVNYRLLNKTPGIYTFFIPNADDITYNVIVYAESHYNTEFSFGNNKLRYLTSVLQRALTTLTFVASGDFVNVGVTDTTLETVNGYESIEFTRLTQLVTNVKKKLLTVSSASNDYGFFITNPTTSLDLTKGTFGEEAVYWETGNYTANGAGTNSTSLTLTSVDDLYIGMQVSYVNSVYQSDLRAITAINTTTKTVTLDGNETWSDTHAIKFRAYGTSLINDAIGAFINISNGVVELGQTTTTNRTELTSNVTEGTAINVNGTTGIGVGATIRMRGLQKNSETTACTVSAVSGSTSAGTITLRNGTLGASSAKPVRVGAKIYVDGSSNLIYFSCDLGVRKFPAADQNIYIDVNRILTEGTAS
tara:strand:+ start:1777 stop:3039 length:1263 start_codon:yes stop_codon:yes gene_type:complete